MRNVTSRFLVVGSGIAGLSCALKLADIGEVALVTKKELAESNTNYAQGGIAAVLGSGDSFDSHLTDTLTAGQGLCDERVVRFLVESGPRMIQELIDFGVHFSKGEDGDELELGKEGGHSHRRIAHAKDTTGAEIERALISNAKTNPRINIFEDHMCVDLVSIAKIDQSVMPGSDQDRCLGAYVQDRQSGEIITFRADATVLATGGAGKVYLYTSNPDIASGDGVAMASRMGAAIANMEFMQFHPTCLYHPQAKSFLVSEAVRGEGAILKLEDGSEFMDRYHDLGCLAPRDIVARAIDHEMKRSGADSVFLDATVIGADKFIDRFPNIYDNCMKYGFDPTREPVPVVPAAHYMCGGVVTDIKARTTIPGLFAIGEVAQTGVHGANRLASNSLLEAVVFASEAVESCRDWVEQTKGRTLPEIPHWNPGRAVDADELVVISHLWDEIRRLMWNYVGIVRTDKRLARAKNRIELIHQEINEYYWDFVVTPDLLELRNLAVCAELIINCAISRKESRGLHYNLDYPDKSDQYLEDTVIR